jgi:hypothetical protein
MRKVSKIVEGSRFYFRFYYKLYCKFSGKRTETTAGSVYQRAGICKHFVD